MIMITMIWVIKSEYEDIFENSDTENHEKDIQKDTMDGNIKDKKVVKSEVKFSWACTI